MFSRANSKGFRFKLRHKVTLLSLFLLCLPYLAYEFVWEMEKYLRLGQEKTLEGTTQALATALHERPKLFDLQASYLNQLQEGRDLYAYPLAAPIKLDGKLGDWQPYKHRWLHYGGQHNLFRSPTAKSQVSFTHMVGKYEGYLYAFFDINDPDLVYRSRSSLSVQNNDHLMIATVDPQGQLRRYAVAAFADGWVNGFALPDDPALPADAELAIQGQWRSKVGGYQLELRIPVNLLGSKLSFAYHAFQRTPQRHLAQVVGTSSIKSVDALGTVLVPSPEIEEIIRGMSYNTARIFVLDRHGRVLAKSGDIRDSQGIWSRPEDELKGNDWWSVLQRDYLNPLYYTVLERPPKDFIDSLEDSTEVGGTHIQGALNGEHSSSRRLTPEGAAVVLSAASPIWIDGKVMGVVVAEETTNGIRSIRNRALEKLFTLMLTVMALGTLSLFIFASGIASRIRKLRNQAEQAIDPQGRVTGAITPSNNADEIGDLSRSFADMVSRLGQYTGYLEKMSSRLSHELRTPVAVVRSSLEHLELQPLAEHQQKYVARAQEGASRLSLILNNMSEATRLEQSLSQAECCVFPLEQVVGGCVQGYQLTYPEQAFEFIAAEGGESLSLYGVPEHIAQLLDKLVDNAREFALPESVIKVSLAQQENRAILQVSNDGPLLPDEMNQQIFESMVSVRDEAKKDKPHLGLGLYIARLICQFHSGEISAFNRQDGSGVVVQVVIPLIK
ncbi:proteobacterial dedicated sortase system histidine kinase [Aliagarivorans marinus]|uniref:proteobacterial dedicated sortase system histidine kinase n=1 Tax=Aliagarivorans marinus TaxID=561965 RepID=UPI00041DFB60|nr:proteobacterial dedicated sortase system histidine kinase [Aliagarivorans marinus]